MERGQRLLSPGEKRLKGGAGTDLKGSLQGTSCLDKPLPGHSSVSLSPMARGPFVHLVYLYFSSTGPGTCGKPAALSEWKEAWLMK